MNIFNQLQDQTFSLVAAQMGYTATWQPLTGTLQVAEVLFNNPDEKTKFSNVNYEPQVPYMEYKAGDLVGLKELVDSRGTPVVTVNNKEFIVLDINTKFDGKTIVAKLQPTA